MAGVVKGMLPHNKLERDLAIQCVLSAFGTGAFLTGTAVFFTLIVGMTGAQVGLGMSISAAISLVLQLPMGRLADRVGAKQLWLSASAVEAALYFVWPFIGGMVAFIAMLSVMTVVESAGRNARNVYRLVVFAPQNRVRANAYMRAARNVGYTLGAATAGIALGVGSRNAVIAVPIVTGALLVLNAILIALTLPALTQHAKVSDPAAAAHVSPAAWRNSGFVALAMCNGILSSNQVLLNVVVPLWLVERTDAPRTVLAWLFATNTVMAVALQVRASRGAESLSGSLRATRLAGLAFLVSCAVLAVTHHTTGALCIALLLIGHVTITGAELWQSASDWGFTSLLSDPQRMGDYQGVWGLGYQMAGVIFPGLFTFLALRWGTPGWFVIAALGVGSALVSQPMAMRAKAHLERLEAARAAAA